jgi:hypothetical protein
LGNSATFFAVEQPLRHVALCCPFRAQRRHGQKLDLGESGVGDGFQPPVVFLQASQSVSSEGTTNETSPKVVDEDDVRSHAFVELDDHRATVWRDCQPRSAGARHVRTERHNVLCPMRGEAE